MTGVAPGPSSGEDDFRAMDDNDCKDCWYMCCVMGCWRASSCCFDCINPLKMQARCIIPRLPKHNAGECPVFCKCGLVRCCNFMAVSCEKCTERIDESDALAQRPCKRLTALRTQPDKSGVPTEVEMYNEIKAMQDEREKLVKDLDLIDTQNLREIPRYWSLKNIHDETQLIDISPGKAPNEESRKQYEDVEKQFLASLFGCGITVKAIKRIENPEMWMLYKAEQKHFHEKYPLDKDEIEKKLFHAGSKDGVEAIARTGFNFNYVSVHRYGEGAYFAEDSEYSVNYAHYDKSTKRCYMLLCRVLTGHVQARPANVTEVQFSQYKEPDYGFDSTGGRQSTNIYVIYKKRQAYPAFLIEFIKT